MFSNLGCTISSTYQLSRETDPIRAFKINSVFKEADGLSFQLYYLLFSFVGSAPSCCDLLLLFLIFFDYERKEISIVCKHFRNLPYLYYLFLICTTAWHKCDVKQKISLAQEFLFGMHLKIERDTGKYLES